MEEKTYGVRPLPQPRAGQAIQPGDEPKRASEEGLIRFKAHVWKVGTLGTGGVRVVLNLDQTYIKEMAMLAECQHNLIELEFQAKQSEG